MNYNDNIKELYNQVNYGEKSDAIHAIATGCGVSYSNVKNNWVTKYPQVPEKHQAKTVEILQKIINKQNQEKEKQPVNS